MNTTVATPADKTPAPVATPGRTLAAAATGTYAEHDIARTRAALRRSGARPSRRAARALLDLAAGSAA